MQDGCQVVAGFRFSVVGGRLLVAGCWLLVVGCRVSGVRGWCGAPSFSVERRGRIPQTRATREARAKSWRDLTPLKKEGRYREAGLYLGDLASNLSEVSLSSFPSLRGQILSAHAAHEPTESDPSDSGTRPSSAHNEIRPRRAG